MEKKNIIIVGAGFGGITAALILEKKLRPSTEYELILIDKNAYQLYTPALYEIAAVPKEETGASVLKSAVTIPLEDVILGRRISFRQDELLGLEAKKKIIHLKSGAHFDYEFLVLALGSETNYFNVPGLEENAFPLKTFSDAVRLRNKVAELVKGSGHLRIVIGGGGATGVELAAEFINYICVLKERRGANQTCNVEVMIVEAAPEILAGFEQWLVRGARRRLEGLGISIKNSCTITSVDQDRITTTTGAVSYDLLVWTGGVRAPKILQRVGLPANKKGQLIVDESLQVIEGVFALGDNAGFPDQNKIPLPRNVPVAEREGRLVAQNIIRALRGRPLLTYVPGKKYPYIVALGKKYAIADLVFVRLSGFWGWTAKLLAELYYLLSILPFGKAARHWISAVRVYVSND